MQTAQKLSRFVAESAGGIVSTASVAAAGVPSSTGLAGVVVGRSAISGVGPASTGLIYRGYPVTVLSKHCQFEEVAHLLIDGKLPTVQQHSAFQTILHKHRKLPPNLMKVLELMPATSHPMDVLSLGCRFIGSTKHAPEDEKDVYAGLMSSFASTLGYWYRFHFFGERINTETDEETLSGHILRLLNQGAPPKNFLDSLNSSLILYADHGTAASTFAARITASTQSDSYSAISSAIGTLKGPLHGGANEAAMELISSFKDAQDAETGIRRKLAQKEKIMGFGHRVYKNGDPRHTIVKEYARELCESSGEDGRQLFKIAETIENLVMNEKGIHPNVDFYTALLYNRCGIATPLFTPLFVVARTAGWGAHILEERAIGKLIRPSSEYVGASAQPFVPLQERQ